MSPRTMAVLAAVAVALAALYGVSLRAQSSPPAPPAWIEFDKAAVTTISVRNPDQGVLRLSLVDGVWTGTEDTNEVRADTPQVDALLTMLGSLKSSDLVSDSPGKHRMFKLDEAGEMVISLGDERDTQKIRIRAGREGAGEFTYMRRQDEPQVWAVKGFEGHRIYGFFRAEP